MGSILRLLMLDDCLFKSDSHPNLQAQSAATLDQASDTNFGVQLQRKLVLACFLPDPNTGDEEPLSDHAGARAVKQLL